MTHKIIKILLSTLVLSLVLAACGGSGADEAALSEAEARVAELEAQLANAADAGTAADAEARIAELEAQLADAGEGSVSAEDLAALEAELAAAEEQAAQIATLEAELVAAQAAADETPGETITVRYLVPQWAASSDRRIERQVAFQSVIDSFELKYPNIQLEEVIYDGSQVTAAQELAAGNVDAIWINNFWYAEWQDAGFFADLTPYMEEGAEAEFFDWTIETLRSVNGELGGLWHNTDTPIYFYRSDLIPEPPQTWGELETAAAAFRAANPDQYLYTTPIANFTQTNMGMYAALGGEFVDESGAPVLFEEGNREIWVQMFEFYKGLVDQDLMPSEAAVNGHNDQMPLIYAGDVVSFVGNNNMHIRALQPNLPPEEYELWSATTLPHPDAADQGLYVAGGWVIALAAQDDPAVQDAAAKWVLHTTSFNALRDTNKAGGWVPTRPAVIEEDAYYANDPFMQVTLTALNEGGWVRPFAPIIGVINGEMSSALASVLSGEATIDEALNTAETTITSEYEALTN